MNIELVRIKLLELQDDDKKIKKLSSKRLLEGLEDIEEVCYYQDFPYVSKVICSELISRYYDNLFVGHFGIKKS